MEGNSTDGDSEEEDDELEAGEEEKPDSEKRNTRLSCSRCGRCCSKKRVVFFMMAVLILIASFFILYLGENLDVVAIINDFKSTLMRARFPEWENFDVLAIINDLKSTLMQARFPELFGDDDPCTISLPVVGVVLVAAPMGVATVVVIVWVLWPEHQITLEDVRRKHRLEVVMKEKELAKKLLAQINVEAPLEKGNGHHEENHSDDDMDSDLDDPEEMFYHRSVPILELGSRILKYWSLNENKTSIISIAKKSQLCILTKQGFDEVNEFLKSLDHPHVQKIFSVRLDESEGDSQVIISQPLWKRGSLRDLINRVTDPFADWAEKYTVDSGRPLPTETVAQYGSQILQAMLYLYKQKFHNKSMCPLGQVQSGNIFIMDDDNCVLGGYENVLLNYRTSLYSHMAHYTLLDYIDIIMFGHVMYEMCTGRSLKNIVPSAEEYEEVENDICREVLHYIFKRNRNGHLSRTIEKISKRKFFFKRTALKATESLTKTFNLEVTESLSKLFYPSIDDDWPRRSRRRYTAGNISRNIKGGWRQTKSMGRSIARSVSPKRWRKSDQKSLNEQDPSSDNEISGRAAETQKSQSHQCRRTLSWSGSTPPQGSNSWSISAQIPEAHSERDSSDLQPVWWLTDVADNTQLGTSERIREKIIKSRKLTHKTSRGKQEAEMRAIEDEGRVQVVEGNKLESDQRIQDLERKSAGMDLERKSAGMDLKRKSAGMDLEEKRNEETKHWLVQREEIHMTSQKLGGGGWGEVKVAEFRGERVAAKVLYKDLQSEYYHDIFAREMNIASRVRSPHLVQFIGASMDGEMVILMELILTSLRQHLTSNAPAIPSTAFRVSVSLDVAKALNYLHLMRPYPIIHRDISSANVLLDPLPNQGWRAKVTDYGSANLQNQLRTENPGSPVYSAPEARIPSRQSTKMDIFSYGILLVEMCTGRLPDPDNRPAMIRSIKERLWVDPIEQCLQQDPEQRPTAAQLITRFSA